MTEQKPKAAPKGRQDAEGEASKPFCGIIMPIASMPGYDSTHWGRVRTVIDKAIIAAGYIPRMVSESEDVGVIHSRIVQNLYDDAIVVCDVSARNANVMFELGMRLAFDKPTVIVKDEETAYSFDTQVIKHIGYRKDQRFDDVERFQSEVTAAILATVDSKTKDSNYSPFLSHFGKFTPKTIEGKEVPQAEFIMNKLQEMSSQLERLSSKDRFHISVPDPAPKWDLTRSQFKSKAVGDRIGGALELITSELAPYILNDTELSPYDLEELRIKLSKSLELTGQPVPDDLLAKLVRSTYKAMGEFRGNSA